MQRAQQRIVEDDAPVKILTPPTTGRTIKARPSSLVAHLPGKHDQSTHGKGGGGVRESLAGAGTIGEINAAASAEAKRITGRDIPFDMAGSDPQLAREYSEGVLQGLERFPGAPLGAVRATDFPAGGNDTHTWAHALRPEQGTSGLYEIEFNRDADTAERMNQTLRMKQARGQFAYGDARGLALHEFGHVMHEGHGTTDTAHRIAWDRAKAKTLASRPTPAPPSRQPWWRGGKKSEPAGPSEPSYDDVRVTLMRDLSFYAVSNRHELAAEAFADVMVNGANASAISTEVMDQLETTVRGA